MTDSSRNVLSEKVESLWSYSGSLRQSINVLRLIGYGLLILAAIDLVDIFVPPQFTNSAWEFALVGQLVERVGVPLIGLGLVFMGHQVSRKKPERLLIRLLSWLSLLIALLFILLIPLGVMSAVRIDRQSTSQLTAQVKQATGEIKEIQDQVSGITTIEQAEAVLSRLDPQNRTAEIQDAEPISVIKDKLNASLSEGERKIESQAKSATNAQRRLLIKNSVKWDVGALVSAGLFFWVWRLTDWARHTHQ